MCIRDRVHDLQVLEYIPRAKHDVPVDVIATPTRLFRTPRQEKPTGIDWEKISDELLDEISLLRRLKEFSVDQQGVD